MRLPSVSATVCTMAEDSSVSWRAIMLMRSARSLSAAAAPARAVEEKALTDLNAVAWLKGHFLDLRHR